MPTGFFPNSSAGRRSGPVRDGNGLLSPRPKPRGAGKASASTGALTATPALLITARKRRPDGSTATLIQTLTTQLPASATKACLGSDVWAWAAGTRPPGAPSAASPLLTR